MAKLCKIIIQFSVRKKVYSTVMTLERCIKCLSDRLSICCTLGKKMKKTSEYGLLSPPTVSPPTPATDPGSLTVPMCCNHDEDSNSVTLKISLLGDSQIGKTSFLVKCVGNVKDDEGTQTRGLNLMDKTFLVGNARISYSIWEIGGDGRSEDHIPIGCKDSVAIFFMFDLTSRCTLNSVIKWYHQARKWNQTAIPILIGTKFDDFIQLPMDLQWTIASQARAYAKALNATLFFSIATYNININKIFKFITAKLFDLPWTVERNLTIGEPMIDF